MSNHLVYALAKIQFGRVTDSKFEKSSDDIREVLRKEYPVLLTEKKLRHVEIKVTPGGQEAEETIVPTVIQTSASKNWGVRIAPDHLFLHTNKYVSFEDFKARMSSLLDIVGPALSIYHTEFVGIRYINKFEINDNDSFDSYFKRNDFLQPKLDDMAMSGSNLSSRYQTCDGWLTVNSGVLVNHPRLADEILNLASDFGVQNERLDGPWAHLDIDSFSANKEMVEYDRDNVISHLESLRGHAKNAYRQIITEDESGE